ncbi:FUSC family protein [Sphingobacterium suaedae]|uniref:FUSC family protein n=1 Tax=Sphingobacterium suaedae TaxID=1686402 RepID=A0ABW5KL26_9SPHI
MKDLIKFNKTTREWHLPFVAGLCVGIPVLLGWYFGNLGAGKLASLAGLGILYMQSDKLNERMALLMTCSFGILTSFSLGLFFSFHPAVAAAFIALYGFCVHYSLYHLGLTRPPGNFFFIMIASFAVCTPFDPASIPVKIGYVGMGAILTCGLGLVYSILTLRKSTVADHHIPLKKAHINLTESLVFGAFLGLSLGVAFLLELQNPYWVPVSCAAVMQGSDIHKVSVRGLQRIVGTLAGLGITWVVFTCNPTPLFIVIGITVLQVIVEFLVVRNYAVAVIFLTILTIFLAESGDQLSEQTNSLFLSRFIDIALGSCIGIVGGRLLYNKRMNSYTRISIRKTRELVRRKQS